MTPQGQMGRGAAACLGAVCDYVLQSDDAFLRGDTARLPTCFGPGVRQKGRCWLWLTQLFCRALTLKTRAT